MVRVTVLEPSSVILRMEKKRNILILESILYIMACWNMTKFGRGSWTLTPISLRLWLEDL